MRFSLFVHMERTSAEQDQQRLYDEFVALAKIATMAECTRSGPGSITGWILPSRQTRF